MRSTRRWWIVLGGFTLVYLGNVCLVGADNESTIEVNATQVTEESKQQQQHLCCARHEKMIDVGYGMSDQVIQVDAGHCRRLCPRHAVDDPGDASRPAVQRCPLDWHCRPNSARLERISTLQGVRVIEAVDSCDCTPKQACSREPYTYVVYPGTPHQADIDVGLCMGHCSKGLGCKPMRNRTISIVGPNGDEVHQVIEECGCSDNCYRMTHVETVLDFSEVEIKDGSNSTEVKPLVRAIDVGQCIGSCPGKEKETCLLRDKKDPTRCLAGLYSKQHYCTPARFKIHEYRSRRGAMREIIAITQCACV
ncbi:uncharacterized protein LOC105684075 isoform X2 [Athalia rosae]|uniref:uncharacterized protein LOC105684075 isoform X2 n=1 Tax=Athalia rosae TaxID=37344 RepID=UPI0020335EF1|nr:uncharacterized protein LOC105684075 isoform X2 [Athalia rosae]